MERTFEGWQVRLRPAGMGRFFNAGFLAIWLTFWVVGEAAVVAALVGGGWLVLTGQHLGGSEKPIDPTFAVVVALFLSCWLTFWTIGGVVAMRSFLQLVWSEDRLVVLANGLRIHRRLGPFRFEREMSRSDLRDVYLLSNKSAVMADTRSGPIELSRLGRPTDLQEAQRELRRELRLDDRRRAVAEAYLPANWREVTLPEGGIALINNPDTRRKQARVGWLISTFAAVAAVALGARLPIVPGLEPAIAIVASFAVLVAAGTLWLATYRREWKVEEGRIELRSRFGSRVKKLFEGRALDFESETDDDGDAWFRLVAKASPDGSAIHEQRRNKSSRIVLQRMHDPCEPRRVGEWLASKAAIAFHDRTASADHAADLAQLRARLQAGGRLGRWVLGVFDRVERRRQRS